MDLKTNTFKDLYALSKDLPQWLRFLWLGLLFAVETWWIDQKTIQTVDQAIKEVEPSLPPSGVPDPVYSETGNDFFDEMRLSAPWTAQEDPSDSPQV